MTFVLSSLVEHYNCISSDEDWFLEPNRTFDCIPGHSHQSLNITSVAHPDCVCPCQVQIFEFGTPCARPRSGRAVANSLIDEARQMGPLDGVGNEYVYRGERHLTMRVLQGREKIDDLMTKIFSRNIQQ